MINDSGERREFETGAVRDIDEDKGRCDLLALEPIANIFDDSIFRYIDNYICTGAQIWLFKVFKNFCEVNYGNLETAMLDVSVHYAEGCAKYGERNWEKGIPLHCYIDSAVRHYLKFLRGDKDEHHDRAFLWNLLGALWTQTHKPELCDLPFSKKEVGE